MAGAKAHLILPALSARLKSCPVTELPLPEVARFSAATKARVILLLLSARQKPNPCYRTTQ